MLYEIMACIFSSVIQESNSQMKKEMKDLVQSLWM